MDNQEKEIEHYHRDIRYPNGRWLQNQSEKALLLNKTGIVFC